ncbi:MAG: short chain dehydrogenase [Bacteroidota bacterium]
MKILVIGGTGTVGKKIVKHFSEEHEVLVANRSSEELPIDIGDSKSIQALFEKLGTLDAIICAAGEARWAPFYDLSEEDYYIGIRSKLMGQVNMVRIGHDYLSAGGSITLTTGILADDPVVRTASAAMVNGAIHSFVQAAALELPNGIRLNAVSCGVVEDAYEKYKRYFPGHYPIPMDKMIKGYERSVEGKGSGQVIRIYE